MFRNLRSNVEMELVVRNGIVIDVELGIVCAWVYMSNCGVSETVMIRVLTDKQRRRVADQVAFDIAARCKNSGRKEEVTNAVFFGEKEAVLPVVH